MFLGIPPMPYRQVYSLKFTFVQLNDSLEVSDLPQRFLHSKTPQSNVRWEILVFKVFRLLIIELLFIET